MTGAFCRYFNILATRYLFCKFSELLFTVSNGNIIRKPIKVVLASKVITATDI